MVITVFPYESSDIPSVKRFNKRLKDADGNFAFPESPISKTFCKDQTNKLYKEYFLAKDEKGEVRGGYMFINQEFNINSMILEVKFLQLPLSEAVINKEYSVVGPIIIQDIQKKSKYIFALGMGSYHYILPKILKRIGWHMYLIPFYFYISNPHAFLNNFEYINNLKKSTFKRILLKIIEKFSLLNFLTKVLSLSSGLHRFLYHNKYLNVKSEIINEFSSFADELWDNNKDFYSIVAKRDCSVLNKLYPKESSRFHRVKISKNEKCIGWTLVICTKMNNDKYFGNLNVGTIVDAFSSQKDIDILINESVKYLKKLNADLIISNHSNHKCREAFMNAGFLKGPSNYIIALSKGFTDLFNERIDFRNSLIMRGDGDGPINL